MNSITGKTIVLGKTVVLSLVVLLTACGENPPPVVSAPKAPPPIKPVTVEKAEVTASPPSSSEETAEPIASPTISITTYDGEETPPEETIASIIAQLKLTTPDHAQKDDTSEISTALTRSTLKPSVPAAPPPNNVIWTLDTDQDTAEKTPPTSVIIPEGQDPSLAADALAAAFAMVKRSAKLDDQLILPETAATTLVTKDERTLRAAVLLPLSGPVQKIGVDIRRGAELAIFTLDNPNIDLTFHDTSKDVAGAVTAAIQQNADLIIGPLFSENARRARPLASVANMPILTFSNDSTVAGQGVWLIGQTPEQDIDVVLTKALNQIEPIDKDRRAIPNLVIIAQDNDYGTRISQSAISLLKNKGGATADLLVLNDEVLMDEKALRQSIKNLTGWLPPSSTGEVKLPKYDMVLLAGHEAFSLRVAPVLSWYDLDPEQVLFIGPSTWNNAAILQEPSLKNGWFADIPQVNQNRFQQIWKDHFNEPASKPAILAFDAIALASTLNNDSPHEMITTLTQDQGFSGFSGLFRFNQDGSNTRLLEIRQINVQDTEIVSPAGTRF